MFDAKFIERKNKVRGVVTKEEKDLNKKNHFVATFKPENCANLKLKLAQNEPITDVYNPVNAAVVFRETHTPENKEPYIVRRVTEFSS